MLNLNGLKSKKLIVALLGAVGFVVNDLMGKPVSEDTIYTALGLLGTYIISQGVADHGSQGAAKAAERALHQGAEVSAVVSDVLGSRNKNKQFIHDDEEDGPNWDDTSDMDEEDKPRELMG